jgi:hypothetical protein
MNERIDPVVTKGRALAIWGREDGKQLWVQRRESGAIVLSILIGGVCRETVTIENYRVRSMLLPECVAAARSLDDAEAKEYGDE